MKEPATCCSSYASWLSLAQIRLPSLYVCALAAVSPLPLCLARGAAGAVALAPMLFSPWSTPLIFLSVLLDNVYILVFAWQFPTLVVSNLVTAVRKFLNEEPLFCTLLRSLP